MPANPARNRGREGEVKMRPLPFPRPLFASAVMVVLLCLCAAESRGALIAYEGFGYRNIGVDLLGRTGGAESFGFAGPWAVGGFNASVHTNYDIAEGSLTFGNLLTDGNRARTGPTAAIAGLTRTFSTPVGAAGTTRYFSFLLRPEGTLNAGVFNGFFGVTLETANDPEVYSGKPGGGALANYVIEDRGGGDQHTSPVPVVIGQTALLVVKAEFGTATDTFTLYVNPTPGGPEPLTGVVKNSATGDGLGFTLYSTGEFSVDELRLGETFADVTPVVPEPGGAVLLLAAAVGLVARRRRSS
jgi:hypothetical protein